MSKSLWSSDRSLGSLDMDMSHKALLDKLAHLATVPDPDFPAYFASFVARVESDFRNEEALMEKIDFAGFYNHRQQHARLLGQLHSVAPAIMAGDTIPGRNLIASLPHWFMLHMSTMDCALSFALQFRRNATLGEASGGHSH